jgi:hypothetical protein
MKTIMMILMLSSTTVLAAPDREKACPILAGFAKKVAELRASGESVRIVRKAIMDIDSDRESREVAGRVVDKVYFRSSAYLTPKEVASDIYEGCMRGEYY